MRGPLPEVVGGPWSRQRVINRIDLLHIWGEHDREGEQRGQPRPRAVLQKQVFAFSAVGSLAGPGCGSALDALTPWLVTGLAPVKA